MKIYKYKNGEEYLLVPDVIAGLDEDNYGMRWGRGRFALNEIYFQHADVEVPAYEYLFDNNKKTNLIYRIHKSMRTYVKHKKYSGSTTAKCVIFAIKEFEETFKEVLEKFDVEFLAINK